LVADPDDDSGNIEEITEDKSSKSEEHNKNTDNLDSLVPDTIEEDD